MPSSCSPRIICFSSWAAALGLSPLAMEGSGAKKLTGARPMGPRPSADATTGVNSTAVAPAALHKGAVNVSSAAVGHVVQQRAGVGCMTPAAARLGFCLAA